MRLLVAGDVHGNLPWFAELAGQAAAHGCGVILQAGDFGFWEHVPAGAAYLDGVADVLAARGLRCVFVDGNHENHALLRAYAGRDDEGMTVIRPALAHAPRGHRWQWDGVRFLALGGAASVDRARRVAGQSWWPEELLTDEEVDAACAGGPADVVVAHDAPWGVDAAGPGTIGAKDADAPSVENRRRVRKVVDAVRPALVVHGHFHHRHSSRLALEDGAEVAVEGLGRDGQGQAGWLVLDLAGGRPRVVTPVAVS